MASWQRIFMQLTDDVEDYFDRLTERLSRRLGLGDPIQIVAYHGYGTPAKLYLKGRVLEHEGVTSAGEKDSIWANLLNMYRRFESDEIVGARLLARFQGAEQEVLTDNEGYFELWIEPREPLPQGRLWHPIELTLLEPRRPNQPELRTQGLVIVPPPGAEFGVISDIDDTVVHTHATDLLLMARTVFLGNARTRLPFKGVAAFYRALHAGPDGKGYNPLFYVSSSPWNLYDLLVEFFELHQIPVSALFLRDWGLAEKQVAPLRHRSHKLEAINKLLSLYDHLQFILIGDSGQEDPEIYDEVVRLYPERIRAIYIRNVSRDPSRIEAIRRLSRHAADAGRSLLLVENTYAAAEHAAAQGWISPAALPAIQAEKELDETLPSPGESLLSEEERLGEPAGGRRRDASQSRATLGSGAVEPASRRADKEHEMPPAVGVADAERQRPAQREERSSDG